MRLTGRLKLLLVVSLAGGAIVPSILHLYKTDLFSSLGTFPLWKMSIPFTAYLLIYAVDALRLHIMLGPFRMRVSIYNCFFNGVLGAFYSNITPMAAGGQPAQILHLIDNRVSISVSTAVILVRFTEYLLLSVIVSIYGLFIYKLQIEKILSTSGLGAAAIIIGIGIYFLLCVIFLIIVLFPILVIRITDIFRKRERKRRSGFVKKIVSLARALRLLRGRAAFVLIPDFILGAVNLMLQAFSLWFILIDFVLIPGGFPAVFTAFVLLNTIAYFVPSPGGSGGIEGIYTLFFSMLTGFGTGVLIVVWRFGSYYLHIGFQILVLIFDSRRKNNEDSNAEFVLCTTQGRDREIC